MLITLVWFKHLHQDKKTRLLLIWVELVLGLMAVQLQLDLITTALSLNRVQQLPDRVADKLKSLLSVETSSKPRTYKAEEAAT
jgi:hypothetical protein